MKSFTLIYRSDGGVTQSKTYLGQSLQFHSKYYIMFIAHKMHIRNGKKISIDVIPLYCILFGLLVFIAKF